MEEITHPQFSDEEIEAFRKAFHKIRIALEAVAQAMTEAAFRLGKMIRKWMESLGRFFLKLQLLEWKLPLRLADFISQKLYWYWAMKLGFYWFRKKIMIV